MGGILLPHKRKCRNSRIKQTSAGFPKSLSKDAAQGLPASGNDTSQLPLSPWCPFIDATESKPTSGAGTTYGMKECNSGS